MEITLRPIGIVRTAMQRKFDAPHQPDHETDQRNTIELSDDPRLRLALSDLEGFSHIWLISWFHLNSNWRSRVLPPRGPAVRRGLFATRSPHRPNPIGLTCVQLYSVTEGILEIGPVDLVDGTPILDIKPYVPAIDSWPDADTGWLQEVQRLAEQPAAFQVELSQVATEQLGALRRWGVDFWSRAESLLEHDPAPHRTRRIIALGDGRLRLACGRWRVFYRVFESRVYVDHFGVADGDPAGPDRDAMVRFIDHFGR